jgi:hypothetical protein
MGEVFTQHRDYKLESYANTNKAHWSTAMRIAYSKRRYLYQHIDAQARRLPGNGDDVLEKLPWAADIVDRQRNVLLLSLDKFLRELKKHDPARRTRARR